MFLAVPSVLCAQSVFLKDGTIVEGNITDSKKQNAIIVQTYTEKKVIKRKEVLRVVFNSDYKQKKYLYFTSGRSTSGYIVYETYNSYIVRKKLFSRKEGRILKKKVIFVSRKKMYFKKGSKLTGIHPSVPSQRKQGIFLKNGNIIYCTQVRERGTTILYRDTSGKSGSIPAEKIKRILYSDSFTTPVYLYFYNNIYEKVYVVEETRDTWVVRNKLENGCERTIRKADVNIVSASELPIDNTKYEYADINIYTMYFPIIEGDHAMHILVMGLTWVDPIRPHFQPYWFHWDIGLLGNANINERDTNAGGGVSLYVSLVFDIWRFIYARLSVGHNWSFDQGHFGMGVFTIPALGFKFTFNDSFFIGLEAGALFSYNYYPAENGGSLSIAPAIYLTFGFNFY